MATAGSGINGPHWPTWAGAPEPLETVTVTGAEVAVLPAPSRARAATVCCSFARVVVSRARL
jgi:hypothetical protein